VKAQRTQRESFLVRIWREGDQKGWQGWVQHTRSGESTPVYDLGELQAFLERWTGKLTDKKRQCLK
jgi:hypothetical protein